MLAILYTEKEAVDLSKKIHDWLKENREGYTADKWGDTIKNEYEDKWFVKIPDDFQKQMKEELTIKEFIPISYASKVLSTWIKPIIIK